MITDRDVTDEVKRSLGTDVADFDVPAIVAEIQEKYGPFAETDTLDVDHDEYWATVMKHATDAVAAEEDEDGCEGHESLNGADMGASVTCDGTCR